MDRRVWLAERRAGAAVVAAYDAEAPAYDEHEYPSDVQREWVARALRLIPPGGTVLDAGGAIATFCCAPPGEGTGIGFTHDGEWSGIPHLPQSARRGAELTPFARRLLLRRWAGALYRPLLTNR